jgi:SAM-dependent methyltransferase
MPAAEQSFIILLPELFPRQHNSTIMEASVKDTDMRPACHICGGEGEFYCPWPDGRGEMRLCRDCNFVFAWPVSRFDPVELFANAYGGEESRAHMDEFHERVRTRQVRIENERLGLWAAAHKSALKWVEANLKKGATVVEVGCGVGSFMHALRRRGYNAVGVDVAPELVEMLKKEGFHTWCGTVDAIPEHWLEREPAAVVCFFVIHHVIDPVSLLSELSRRWRVPLLMGCYRGTLGAPSPAEYPPRTWGWWTSQSIEKAFKLGGYSKVNVTTQPKITARMGVPKGIVRIGSPMLWRWPGVREFVGLGIDTTVSAAFRMLGRTTLLKKPFEGDYLVIGIP